MDAHQVVERVDQPRHSSSLIEKLPLEVLRHIASFCSARDVALILPTVSHRFHDACTDVHLLKLFIRLHIVQVCLSYDDNWETPFKGENLGHNLLTGITDFMNLLGKNDGDELVLRRWTMAFYLAFRMLNDSLYPHSVSRTGFRAISLAMECLPHVIILEPTVIERIERRWAMFSAISTIACSLLDADGGPGFPENKLQRSARWDEADLRKAICLLALVFHSCRAFHFEDLTDDEEYLTHRFGELLSRASLYAYDQFRILCQQYYKQTNPTCILVNSMIIMMTVAIGGSIAGDIESTMPTFSCIYRWDVMDGSELASIPTPGGDQRSLVCGGNLSRPSERQSFFPLLDNRRARLIDNVEISKGTWQGCFIVLDPGNLNDSSYISKYGIKFTITKTEDNLEHIQSEHFSPWNASSNGCIISTAHCSYVMIEESAGFPLPSLYYGFMTPFGIAGIGIEPISLAPMDDIAGNQMFSLFWLWKEEWVL